MYIHIYISLYSILLHGASVRKYQYRLIITFITFKFMHLYKKINIYYSTEIDFHYFGNIRLLKDPLY